MENSTIETNLSNDLHIKMRSSNLNEQSDLTVMLPNIGLSTIHSDSSFYSDIYLKHILSNAFYDCSTLTSIYILNADEIDDNAFSKCINVQQITLPGISAINDIFGQNRDELSNLTILTISDGTESIGTNLSGLISLTKLNLPSTLSCLEYGALSNDKLYQLNVPNKTSLCSGCFLGLSDLNSLSAQLYNNLDYDIGLSTLENLERLYFKRPSTSIDLYQIAAKTNAKSIIFEDNGRNIRSIPQGSFEDCKNLTAIDFSNSTLDTIPTSAFANCSSMISIAFPRTTLNFMRKDSFLNCINLNALSIPNSVINIDGPLGVKNIDHIPPNLNTIGPSAFYDVYFVNNVPIQLAQYAYVGEYAFSGNCNLSNVSFRNSSNVPAACFINNNNIKTSIVTHDFSNLNVQASAFYGCRSLENCIISSSTRQTYIHENAFAGTKSLTSIGLCNVVEIGPSAFYGSSLQNDSIGSAIDIEIPESVTSIGKNAFAECKMTQMYLNKHFGGINGNIQCEESIFKSCNNLRYIEIPANYEEFRATMSSDYNVPAIENPRSSEDLIAAWQALRTIFFSSDETRNDITIKLNDFRLNSDGNPGDYRCLSIENNRLISVDTSAIDFEAFTYDPVLPPEITDIADHAFDSAVQSPFLTAISLVNVRNPGLSTFANTRYMFSANAPSISSITDSMFFQALNLKNIDANDAQYVRDYAFYGCSNLTSINISNAKEINEKAFYDCYSLSNINTDNVSSFSEQSFSYCSSLTEIICNSQINIGPSAFYGCNNLSSIKPYDLISVYVDAFNSTNLCSLSISNNTKFIQNDALRGLNANTDIFFINMKPNDVIDKFMQFKNNAFGTTVGQKFYTSLNNYSHPSFITIASNEIIEIENPAFQCYLNQNDGMLALSCIDDNYLDETQIIIDGSLIKYIDSINSEKLETIMFIGDNEIILDKPEHIAQNAFNSIDNPNLRYVYATNTEYVSNESLLSDFWQYVSDGNSNLTIFFADGDLSKDGFNESTDPFMKTKINGQLVIYNVDNNRVQNNQQTIIRGNVISSFAFRKNSYAADRSQVITDLAVEDSANLTSILSNAFSMNTTLTCVSNLGNMIKYIDETAFDDCGIKKITIPSSLVNNFGNGVKGYGLNNTISLTSLTYSEGISAIAPSAMINCQSLLAELTFPTTLTSIKEYAFAETNDVFPRITNMNLSAAKNLVKIDDYAFYNSISTLAEDTLVIPSSLTSIGAAAFAYRRDAYTQVLSNLMPMSEIEFNDKLVTIGPSAFMYNHFKNISLPSKLSTIDDYAFAFPKYKQNIHVLSNIAKIGHNAFLNNVILNPDNISANVICIDVSMDRLSTILGIDEISSDFKAYNNQGFTDGTVISAIHPENNPTVSFAFTMNGFINFCPNDISIDLIDKNLVNADKSVSSIYVPDYLTAIGPSAFVDCSCLTSVSAISPLKINEYAFVNCSALLSIYQINEDKQIYELSNVDPYTFYNCYNLSNIELLSSCEYIGEAAFCNCSSIQNLYSNESLSNFVYFSLSSIGPSAFYNCSSLSSFQICPKIIQIGQDAFNNCSKLSNIEIAIDHQTFLELARGWSYINDENSILKIEQIIKLVFGGINKNGKCLINFTDVSYTNDGVIKIDNDFVKTYTYIEKRISKLAVYGIADNYDPYKQHFLNLSGINRVDAFAFENQDQIYSISFLPKNNIGLEYINDYAFYGCTNLMNINSNALSCKTIGCYAFANCKTLLNIQLDFKSLEMIKQGAFYNTSLNTLFIANCPTTTGDAYSQTLTDTVKAFQNKINYSEDENQNPLELPEFCNIVFKDINGNIIGKFDYLFHDLTHATIDTNRNTIVFIDKMKDSIKPLLLVRQSNKNRLPAIVENSFHANVIGRWK